MSNTKNIPKRITVGEIIRLRECEDKDRFVNLGISDDRCSHRKMIGKVLDVFIDSVKNQDNEKEMERKVLEQLETEYLEIECELPFEKETAMEKDSIQLCRMIRYFSRKKCEVVASNETYFIDMPHTSYRGHRFDAIGGRTDLIVRDVTGEFEAITFVQQSTEYSYMSRKECNKPENSIELLCMKLGLEEKYPGITCSLYHLKNKDDKADFYPEFEHRRGKNIISWSFKGQSRDEIFSLLGKAVTLATDCDCQSCSYLDVCKLPKVRQMQNGTEGNLKLETKKPATVPTYTDAQKEVIYHKDGPMSVIAVPGAGKTYSLVQRMKYLIKEEGISANRILLVTFTKKACKEIEERVKRELGTEDENQLPSILTLNALGYKILRENPSLVGKRVKLVTITDRKSIIRDVLGEIPRLKGCSYQGLCEKYGLISRLDKEFQKIDSLGEEKWKESFKGNVDGFLTAYHRYEEIFEEREKISYDEQIMLCNQLFEDYPSLSALYSKVYRYIMVDEFQDVSEENVKMIYSIAKHHGNIVVVGDDDQSIYSFRGGSNKFLLDFPMDFPEARTVVMNDNFRSNDKILKAGDALIKENTERYEKDLIAHETQEYKPLFYHNFNEKKLVGLVKQILENGYKPGEIAILARNNKNLFRIADVLSDHVAVMAPKDYLIEDAIFLSIQDVLSVFYQAKDMERSIYRLLCYLGEKPETNLENSENLFSSLCRRYQLKPLDVYSEESAAFYKEAYQEKNGIKHAMGIIYQALKYVQYAENIPDVLQKIVKEIFGMEKHRVCDILSDMADERAIVNPKDLFIMIQDMCRFGDETRVGYDVDERAVNLLTAHDAKGKEFPAVIVYAAEDFGNDEEERRLLYVAMTRAKKALFVTESEYQRAGLISKELEKRMAVCS